MELLVETPLGVLPRSQVLQKLSEAGIDSKDNCRLLEASIEVYEPKKDDPRYVEIVRRKTCRELWEEVKEILHYYVPEWESYFDYIGGAHSSRLGPDMETPENWAVACFVVKGASEGYYLHCDLIIDGRVTSLFLGKTLCDNPQTAWDTAQAISLMLEG